MNKLRRLRSTLWARVNNVLAGIALGQLIAGVLVVTGEYSSGAIRLLCVYVLAALAAGGWLLTRRDA
ncbi:MULTISPECIES: hypothetical protein [unclassified Streptomyces]|uniref:hypothetical protein n=1 Tax=Streptomyces sp. NPDC059916 TaxID=3347001 RepID=UPI0036BC6741